MLAGRRVVLGVTGGVAAYKAAYLARRLIERGAVVRTVMTQAATEFLGPHTLAAITGERPVSTCSTPTMSARTPALADGRTPSSSHLPPQQPSPASRTASPTILSPQPFSPLAHPVVIAPAMHTEMWEHPATVSPTSNASRPFGYHIVGPAGRSPRRRRHRVRPHGGTRPDRRRRGRCAPRGSADWCSRGDHRRRHPRADRRCPVPRQPLVGQDGQCHRRRSRPPRRAP